MTQEYQERASLSPVQWAIYATWLAALGTYLSFSFIPPAVFRHLAIGEFILSGRALPVEDLWTTAGAGRAWHSESWLMDVTAALVVRQFGLAGIAAVKILLCCLFAVLASVLFWKKSGDLFAGSVLGALVSCGVLASGALGAEVVCLVFLVCGLFWGELCWRKSATGMSHPPSRGTSREKDGGCDILVALFLILLSNFSLPAFIFFLIGFTAAGMPRRYWVLAAVSLFLTPYIGRNALSMLSSFPSLLFSLFPGWTRLKIPFDYDVAFLLVVAGFAAVAGWRKKSAMTAIVALLVAPLFIWELLPFSLTGMGWIAAAAWADRAGENPFSQGVAKFRDALSRLHPTGVVWLLLCITIVNTVKLKRGLLPSAFVPEQALTFHLDRRLELPILSEPHVGSYVLYRLSTSAGEPRRVPFDDRLGLFEPALARAFRGRELSSGTAEEILARFAPKTAVCFTADRICRMLAERTDWVAVYPPESGEGGSPASPMPPGWKIFARKHYALFTP